MSRRKFQLIEGTSQKFFVHRVGRYNTHGSVRPDRPGRAVTSQGVRQHGQGEDVVRQVDRREAQEGLCREGWSDSRRWQTSGRARPRPAVPEPARAETVGKGKEAAASASEPASPPPAVEAAPVALSTARVIELDPDDWLWAAWRAPHAAAAARANALSCRRVPAATGHGHMPEGWLRRLGMARGEGPPARQRLIGETREGWVWDWTNVGLAPTMTREEAQFWFVAMTEINNDLKPEQLVARVDDARKTISSAISTTEALRKLKSSSRFLSDAIVIPLLTLFSPGEWLDLLQKTIDWDEFQSFDAFHGLIDGVRRHVLPAPHGGGAPNDRGRPSTDARHSLTPA